MSRQYVIWDIQLYALDEDGDPLTDENGKIRLFTSKYHVDMSQYVFDEDEVEEVHRVSSSE